MTGTRKINVFYVTMAILTVTILGSFLFGVDFQGDDIIAIMAITGTVSGMFFGANFGEHWAARK